MLWERQLGKGPWQELPFLLPSPTHVPLTTGTGVQGIAAVPRGSLEEGLVQNFPFPHSLPAGSLCGLRERHQSQDEGETEKKKETQRKSSEGL